MPALHPRTKGVRVVRAALLMAACVAPLAAQAQASARIEGRVIDSIHARVPAGVIVQAVRLAPAPQTFASVQADSAGRYRFDSLAAGRYWVSFSSPFTDSLHVVLPDYEVAVADGGQAVLDLAIPSAATLRAAACPGMVLVGGQGVGLGTVQDAATEQTLPGATVVVAWTEVLVDNAKKRVVTKPRTSAMVVDSSGHFRFCGVPTDVPLQLQVQHAGVVSGVVHATVRDSAGMLRHDLSLNTSTTGMATLTGVVVGRESRPLADVQLQLAGTAGRARTDSLGRFMLSGLPAGSQMLEARGVGYFKARVSVELRSGRSVSQRIQLLRAVSLDSVRIVGERPVRGQVPDEFVRRRTDPSTMGKFLDADQINALNAFDMTDVFRTQLGFHVIEGVLYSTRGGTTVECPVNLVVEGVQGVRIETLEPKDIAGMEIYRSSAGAPPPYDASCGLILIWLKR
ncbi:MAG: carboxypeptidase regulatory-like domain-containing protein [Polaromonas sp.]|nr:carboxypeptidase regulatory-like domain-containing protein [Gemmatimonadaceae bacterium]